VVSKSSVEKSSWLSQHFEKVLLPVVVAGLAGSVVFTLMLQAKNRDRIDGEAWVKPEGPVKHAKPIDLGELERLIGWARAPRLVPQIERVLFTSEKRVWAVGSYLPIPYTADVCTFSGVAQPPIEEFDQDEDGIPDVWESRYGFNVLSAADAQQDADQDGFINLEEYQGKTDPKDPTSRPSYAAKLRVERIVNTPFKLLYRGYSEFSVNVKTFQLNLRAGGKTYFCDLGQEVMDTDNYGVKTGTGIMLESYDAARDVLSLKQGDVDILLQRDVPIDAFEVKALLINLLDNKRMATRVGQTIELKDGVYVVKSIGDGKVIVESPTKALVEILEK
jgi:hypothetical protein